MSDSVDRYRRGLEILAGSGIAGIDPLVNRVAEVSPEFAGMAIGFPFGEIFARPNLDLATRHAAAIAALVAIGGAEPQLRVHVAAALSLGWSREQLIEIVIQTAIHAGFPAALNALAACHDQLTTDTCAPCHRS